MDKELTIIAEPEELIAWADTFDILLNPSIEDAAILLNYMEGHDYAIGIDSDGKMYRQDVAEENGEIEPYLWCGSCCQGCCPWQKYYRAIRSRQDGKGYRRCHCCS